MKIIGETNETPDQEVPLKTNSNSITSPLGQAIRAQRVKKKLSQEKLADLASLHRTYIGSVERGERNITIINCEKIAHALRVRTSQLLHLAEKLPRR